MLIHKILFNGVVRVVYGVLSAPKLINSVFTGQIILEFLSILEASIILRQTGTVGNINQSYRFG